MFLGLMSPSGSHPAGLDAWVGEEPTPELLAVMDEEYQRLLGRLRNDGLRQIAIWRMQGDSTEEIAQRLDMTVRSVGRKLKLIRDEWSGESLKSLS